MKKKHTSVRLKMIGLEDNIPKTTDNPDQLKDLSHRTPNHTCGGRPEQANLEIDLMQDLNL